MPEGSGVAGATWALLAAAGSGERLGIDRPKAFAVLGGRPLVAESLDRLDRCELIDSIVVAAPPGWEEPTILLAEELAVSKVVACVPGGATRAESVAAALAEVPDEAVVVLVHDAARPLLGLRSWSGCSGRSAKDTTAPCRRFRSPTRSSASAAALVDETLDRRELYAAQTPQAFLLDALRRAFAGELA